MEFSGDEKRIQALFSELSLENQRRTPRFEKLWLRAEANAAAKPLVTGFVTALVAVTVIVVMGLAAARLWSSTSQSQQATNIPAQIIPTTSQPRIQQPEQLLSKNVVRPRRFVRRPSERTAIRQAAMISKWQSPTNILLNSPRVSVLSTLPQLNQSARELEQFLPKNK
jgi:hypothetical protein